MSVLSMLAGCAMLRIGAARSPVAVDASKHPISAALLAGKGGSARDIISDALRLQPSNGYYHLLNGLSYQIEDRSMQSLALARVGYDAAVKFSPDSFWAHYLAGAAALELHDDAAASEHFSCAILADPHRPQAFLGLTAAAYHAGDLDVARAAADRALALAPRDRSMLRAAAYVAAARGDGARLEDVRALAKAVPEAVHELALEQPRLMHLLQAAALPDVPPAARVARAAAKPANPVDAVAPKQVMVEVTLLLNQASTTHSAGINLLDGLTVQFGLNYATQEEWMTGAPTAFTRVFTSALRVPEITYSLNLFNTKDDFYRVITRPSLVASLKQTSEFFIGKTVSVAVSGINLGNIQLIDLGTYVRVTPAAISPTQAEFKIEVIRSFPIENAAGTFEQALTAFKQTVSATAEVEFGKTLILSGLYEGVDLGGYSKTPVVGDVPGVDTLFNARRRQERRDVALVLVTPKLAGMIETDTVEFRGDMLNRLLFLWNDYIDPTANMDAIIGAVRPGKLSYYGTYVGDIRLPPVTDPDTLRAVVNETVAQLR